MLPKHHECWSTDPNVYALRVEVSPDRSVQIPYEHLLHTELITYPDRQELRLSFVAHEVVVVGSCLRRIEAAIQKRELGHLCVLTPMRGRMSDSNEPHIQTMEVKHCE